MIRLTVIDAFWSVAPWSSAELASATFSVTPKLSAMRRSRRSSWRSRAAVKTIFLHREQNDWRPLIGIAHARLRSPSLRWTQTARSLRSDDLAHGLRLDDRIYQDDRRGIF